MSDILCVGTFRPDSTSWARYRGLVLSGQSVDVFDTDRYTTGLSTLRRRLEIRLFYGPAVQRLNRELRAHGERTRPKVVWIDKGIWIYPDTVRYLRSLGALLVEHNTDLLRPTNINYYQQYVLLRRSLALYDVYLTTNSHDFHKLRGSERPIALLTDIGYDSERFRPAVEPSRGQAMSDIVFVGHREPAYEEAIFALLQAGLPVSVNGAGWERRRKKIERLGGTVGPMLSATEYETAIRRAKIGLGLLSRWNRNDTAGRSFEIPASGTFLLGVRTRAHCGLYREGVEAEFFGSPTEMVEKAAYYLSHEDRRNAIAQAGHMRCIKERRSWQDITLRDLSHVLDVASRAGFTSTALP